MLRTASSTDGPQRDLLCKAPSAFLFWCVPLCAFALGFGAPIPLKTVLWATSLGFMGVMCLFNAFRCGRVHCLFTGPFFILSALVTVGYALGVLPFGPSGWKWIGTVTIIGAIALCCIPELILGRYRRRRADGSAASAEQRW
jgi:hypothetical protein